MCIPFESAISTIPTENNGIIKISCATYMESLWQILQNILNEKVFSDSETLVINRCETILIDIDKVDAEIKQRKEMIRQALTGGEYGSLSYIAMETGFNIEEVKALVESDNMFRKSIIRTKKGDEVYMLNTKFSALVDAWRAFRDFNAKVYY
jgi:hypothetical protein